MKKIIVFGATGTIGAYLIDYLQANLNNYEIIAVGKRDTNFFRNRNVEYYSIDNTNERDFVKLPRDNVNTVINLAGILPAYMEGYKPLDFFKVNTIGGFNVLDYAKDVNSEKFIYTQSISDLAGYFGNKKELLPNLERNIKYNNDHTLYVISKCAIVDAMEDYRQRYGLKTFTLRLPNIYMFNDNKYYYVDGIKKIIAYRYIIDRALKSEKIEIWGDYTKEKDIVYVKDFCQMVYKIILSPDINNGLYNVGTGKGTSLLKQIEGIVEIFCPSNKKSELIFCPEKPNNPEYIMNIDNAIKELGYMPKYDYISLLKDFKKEMEINRYKDLTKSFIL